MPPPVDFEILRARDARRSGGGETKEELLRQAKEERTTRADARRRKHGALTVQRMWRGCASRARSRAATLARWDERFGSARTSPTPAELFDALLPPLRLVGAARAGATRTLRALALALGTSDLCAEETREKTKHWTVKTRRLADFALDALAASAFDTDGHAGGAERSEDASSAPAAGASAANDAAARERRMATRECATRLLAATHAAVVASAAETRRETLAVDAAVAYHARLCDAAASLVRARDASGAKTLTRLAVDAAKSSAESARREASGEEDSEESANLNAARFAARATANVAARLFGGADTALGGIARPAWFASLLEGGDDASVDDVRVDHENAAAADREMGAGEKKTRNVSRLESFLAAFRDEKTRAKASAPVGASFDPVAAANNLVWCVTAWHPAAETARGGELGSAKAARARLASLPRSSARALVETLDVLLRGDVFVSRGGRVPTDTERSGASASEAACGVVDAHRDVPALREAWFVAGVARDGDAASLDALAGLYWRAARNPDAPEGPDELRARRGMLGALAFAPGTVRALWLRCASRIPAAVSISAANAAADDDGEPEEGPGGRRAARRAARDPGAGGPGLWTSPALALGAASVAADDVPLLGAFALAYAHLLEVLDDDEFFEAQTPFSLSEQRAVAAAANTLVARERLRRVPSSVVDEGDASATAKHLARDRRAVVAACASLLRALVTRDERRPFAPDGMWLAPLLRGAGHVPFPSDELAPPLPPAAAASALLGAARGIARGTEIGRAEAEAEAATTDTETGFVAFMRDCPHALPFETRVEIFRNLVVADRARLGVGAQAGGVDADRATQGQRVVPVARLRVRRSFLLEDTLAGLGSLGSRAKGRIAVTFVNAAGQEEAGIDAGGLFKELLGSALAELVDPRRGLFRETDNQTSSVSLGGSADVQTTESAAVGSTGVYPVARAGDDPESAALLELAGLLMGKALYEGVLHEFRLAPFFAKKTLGKPLSLDDLPSLDAALHRSLRQVLRYEGDVSDLCLDWYAREDAFGRVVAHALRPGEKTPEDVVESHDALAWAHATAEFHLARRRRAADAAFERGLASIIPNAWLRLFGANELGSLMTGDADGDVDVDDLRAHCAFGGGYTARSRTVKMFWECVSSFTRDERKALLRFVTSSPAPPVRGFKHLHPPFTLHKVRCDVRVGGGGGSAPAAFLGAALASLGVAGDVERLPTASTCFNVLKLPNFRRLATMKAKLRTAMRSGAGFELS